MSETNHISISQFDELKELLAEDFIDLINTYMSDSRQRLAEMDIAFVNMNNRLGFDASHNLKGASSNLGAVTLTQLCYELQEVCRAGQIHQHEQLIEDIKTECHAVNDQIQSLIQQA